MGLGLWAGGFWLQSWVGQDARSDELSGGRCSRDLRDGQVAALCICSHSMGLGCGRTMDVNRAQVATNGFWGPRAQHPSYADM